MPTITVHERTLIREYARRVLSTPDLTTEPPSFPTACGTNVFKSRVEPLIDNSVYPCIGIYTGDEDTDRKDSDAAWPDPENPGYLKRSLALVVLILVKASEPGFDDELDAIALQVEKAFDADPSFGKLVESIMLSAHTASAINHGDITVGALRMVWEVIYRTPTRCGDPVEGPHYTQVLASWVPKVGIPFKDQYVDIRTGIPPVLPGLNP